MSNNRHNSPAKLDVLIVYSDLATLSASTSNSKSVKPFKSSFDKFNDVYAYLLQKCEEIGLSAAFSTTKDISGSGSCSSYWIYKEKNWLKVNQPCYSTLIFDKFFPRNSLRKFQRKRMFLSPDVKPFTSTKLLEMFFDKLQTYSDLKKYSVPTVNLNDRNKQSIEDALLTLKEKITSHDGHSDFQKSIIMKDRYGSGGNHIYSITSNFIDEIFELLKDNDKVSFILQPYVAFEKGYQYRDKIGATEIRLIYRGKKVVQAYIRVAGATDFICNNGSGGIWISPKDIPKNVKQTASKIAKILNKKNAIFALDFIVSDNGNVYLLEANVSPGIDWYENNPQNKKMNKAMIDIIVEELYRRVEVSRIENSPANFKTMLGTGIAIGKSSLLDKFEVV